MINKALSFFRPDALGEVLPLYKIVETSIEATKEEFHNISGSFTPGKAVLDRVADASGISYLQENCGVKIEKLASPYYGYTDLRFVGYAQGEVTEPDGTKRRSSVCEYEFDVMIRSEEEFLKDDSKYPSDIAKKKYVLKLTKVARARANTGARSRVVRELTGMPTGFKANIFNGNDVVMHFKKVVANPENEMVLKAGLKNMFGTTESLYGKRQQLQAPEVVSLDGTSEPKKNIFTSTEKVLSPEEKEKIKLQTQIREWTGKYDFPAEAKPFADAALSDEIPLVDLKKNWEMFNNHLVETGQIQEANV
jgi:hypothetical protein